MFFFSFRTCKLLEAGIKPVYVFDGKAPELKGGELAKRKERREEADKKLKEAQKADDQENVNKFSRRLVRVTRQHNEDCKKLLQLMGVPIICSPSEAEAQCAQLCKEGLVYAVATEDMDGLTFGSPRLVRHLSSGNTDKVKEYSLEKVLAGFELTQEQFIDLCILMGCDYCESIKGIGGKKGLDLIRKLKSIETLLREKYDITEFAEVTIDYKDKIVEEIEEKEEKEEVKNGKEEDAANRDVSIEKIKKEDVEEKEDGEKDKNNDQENKDDSEPVTIKKEQEEDDMKKSDDEKHEEKEKKNDDEDMKIKQEAEDQEDSGAEIEDDNEEAKGSGKKSKKGKKASTREIVPKDWLFKGARQLFVEPNVIKGTLTDADLKMKDIDEEGLIQFLCVENGFSEDRVKSGIKRIKESKSKSAQTRIDSFFTAMPSSASAKKPSAKRPSNEKGSASKRGRGRPR